MQGAAGGAVVQIAVVLRDIGLVTASNTKGILQIPTHGQQCRPAARQLDGLRDEAAGATDEPRRFDSAAQHAVVATLSDIAIMAYEKIGDTAQSRKGLAVVAHQRFAPHIGGGADQD